MLLWVVIPGRKCRKISVPVKYAAYENILDLIDLIVVQGKRPALFLGEIG